MKMKGNIAGPCQSGELRRRAETAAAKAKARNVKETGERDLEKLVHELQVHQIELEMQNDELARANLEVEESRNKYYDLFNFAPVGYFTLDREGRIRELNFAGCKLLAGQRGEIVSRNFRFFVAPEHKNEFNAFFELVYAETIKRQCELKLNAGENAPLYARLEGIALRNEAGDPLLCRLAVIDITRRRQAEDILRASESRYRSLFENMLDGFAYCQMIYDGQGRPADFVYLDVNASFGLLTGLKNVVRKKVSEIIPGIRESNPELFEIYGRVASSGVSEKLETYLPSLDIWLSISVYSTEKGYFIAVFDNITGRKKAEEILRRDKEAFERLVNEKTQELLQSHRDLARAQRMSDIGRLATTIAHEIRNPLAAIKIAAYNINRKAKNPALDRHLGTVNKKILESDQIIQNLLGFTRIKSAHYEQIRFVELLRDCLAMVSGKYTRWKVSLAEDIRCNGDALIEGDFIQLRMLFSNMLDNAYQSLQGKKGTVTVSLAVDPPGQYRLVVTDTGVGIGTEDLGKIFEPFFTTKSKGTGLGLAVCKEIVDGHGGTIDVKSTKGKGTTFIITLPARQLLASQKKS